MNRLLGLPALVPVMTPITIALMALGTGCSSNEPPRTQTPDASALDADRVDASVEDTFVPDGSAADSSVEADVALLVEAGPQCTATFVASDAGTRATVTVDTSSIVNTFVPKLLFGINTGYWASVEDSIATQPKVQAAGNYLIRYPGGSSSDDYHWNGAGTYDAAHRWVPSDTIFESGFPGTEKYRGTTSLSYSTPGFVTDGDVTTYWLSNADTAFPNAQWVYVDLGSTVSVSSIMIGWGSPYATSFRIQTWSGSGTLYPPYQATGGSWLDTSAGLVAGSGATQVVDFAPVATEFVRVLMTASSDGASGAYAIAEVTAFGPAADGGVTQLTNNTPSMSQSATVASTTDPANDPISQSNFDFESFMTYVRSFTPVADPVLTVNVGTGTPQEAAAWVHYANIVKGYGIRYWQIGNEMEGFWETGGPLNAQDYVKRYVEYYDAMKAVDPSIVILGPVSGGPNEPSNLGDGNLLIQDFIGLLHAAGMDDHINAIDTHWYPNYGPVSDTTALATPAQLGRFATNLHSWLSAANLDTGIPVFLTEFNIGLIATGSPLNTDQLINGVWLANALGEYIRYFGHGGGTNLWNMMSGWTTSDTSDPTQGDLGYLQHNVNEYRFQEHADYWAMQMMSSDWAIGGDTRTHSLVATHASDDHLAAYADLRPDGSVSVAIVNTDLSTSYTTSIDIAPFAPDPAADVWTFGARNYVWETSTVPYHASPDSAPTHALMCGASASTPVTFPPESITVIRFAPVGGPWAIVPDAGSEDAGPRTTLLVDDMTSANGQIRLLPQRSGDSPGYWYTYIGGGADAGDLGSITPAAQSEITDGGSAWFGYTALNPDSGSAVADAGPFPNGACISGQTPVAQYAFAGSGFGLEIATTDAGNVPQPADISAYAGFQFWAYNGLPTTTVLRFQVQDTESIPSGGVCGGDASTMNACYSSLFERISFTAGWSFHQVPYRALATDPYWGYQQPVGGDMTQATDVQFEVEQTVVPDGGGAGVPFDFCIADMRLYK